MTTFQGCHRRVLDPRVTTECVSTQNTPMFFFRELMIPSFPPPVYITHIHNVIGRNLWDILSPSPHLSAKEPEGMELVWGDTDSKSHTRDSNSRSKFPTQCPLHIIPAPWMAEIWDPLQTLSVLVSPPSEEPRQNFHLTKSNACPEKTFPRPFPHLSSLCWPWTLAKSQKHHKPQFSYLEDGSE